MSFTWAVNRIGNFREEQWTTLSEREKWKCSLWPHRAVADLPNPGIKPRFPHYRRILYHLSHRGSNIQRRPTPSSELHSIRVGAPEMESPASSQLYLGLLVERMELSNAHFKLGSYWREIWQVPTMGDWPQRMEVFLATDLQTRPAVSLMFTMGHLLEVRPSIHLGSPEQLGGRSDNHMTVF